MDQIPNLPTQELPGVIVPTWQLYAPLLNANADTINSVPKQTFSYGDEPRQKLDVYLPKKPSKHLLIFFYGGGFQTGDRVLPFPPLNKLAYANLASFFVLKYSFTVVIPDYHRIPDSDQPHFTQAGQDLALTMKWISQNPQNLGLSISGLDIHILGNSAGGAHSATFLLHPDFQQIRQRITSSAHSGIRLRSVILLSAALELPPWMTPLVGNYFGTSPSSLVQNSPLGLLRALDTEFDPPEFIEGEVRVLVARTQFDPPAGFRLTCDHFVAEWEEKLAARFGERAQIHFMDFPGHNHISPAMALGTGIEKEEQWGHMVAEWILSP